MRNVLLERLTMNDQQQSSADALTDDDIAENAQQYLATREPCDIYQFRRDELLTFARAILAASPVEQPAAAPIDEPSELEQVIACLGDDAATLRHADEYVEMADNMEAAARLLTALEEDRAAEVMCNRWPWERVSAPSPADERAAFEAWWTRDVPAEHKASAYALLKQFGDDYAANKRCAEAWEVWQARAASAIIDAGHAIPEHWRVKAEHIVSMDRDPAKREEAGKTAVMLLRVLLKDPHARAAASPAAAEAVAQWQTRVRDVILPENKRWVNVSEDGAKTVLEKYADTYEVRALYAAPPPAQADAREGLTADMRESVEHAATWLARSEDLQNKAHAERLRALLQGANHA